MPFVAEGVARLLETGLYAAWVGLHTGPVATADNELVSNRRPGSPDQLPFADLTERTAIGYFRAPINAGESNPIGINMTPRGLVDAVGALFVPADRRDYRNQSQAVYSAGSGYTAVVNRPTPAGIENLRVAGQALLDAQVALLPAQIPAGRWPAINSYAVWSAQTGGHLLCYRQLLTPHIIQTGEVQKRLAAHYFNNASGLNLRYGWSISVQPGDQHRISPVIAVPAATSGIKGTMAQVLAALDGPLPANMTLSFHTAVPTVQNKVAEIAEQSVPVGRVGAGIQNTGQIVFPAPAALLNKPAYWALSWNANDFIFNGLMSSSTPNVPAGTGYMADIGAFRVSF